MKSKWLIIRASYLCIIIDYKTSMIRRILFTDNANLKVSVKCFQMINILRIFQTNFGVAQT